MIFHTAYDTTVGSGVKMDKILFPLKQLIIKDGLKYGGQDGDLSETSGIKPRLITGGSASEVDIPSFTHPFPCQGMDKEDKFIFCDVRSFVKPDIDNRGFVVRSTNDYNLTRARLALDLAWMSGQVNYIRDLSIIPCAVYASWISEGVGKRFALDPKDQLTFAVVCAIYYQTLFVDSDELTEQDLQNFAAVAIKVTRAPAPFVFSIVDKITTLKTIHDLCDNVKAILENTRINDLNPGILITILNNSWFGFNAKELLAVALEHPPTWMSIVYASINDRSFRNSLISKISDRYTGSKGSSDFVKAFVSYTKNMTKNNNSF